MEVVLIAVRLLLAAVFVTAGAAKLADRAGSVRALRDFGIPAAFLPSLGLLLPLAEIATAVALLTAASAWYGALAALGLLLCFCVAIAVNLVQGRNPDCHCFGQLHSAPASWSTLARNGALTLIAGLVVLQGRDAAGPSAVAWIGAFTVGELLGVVGGLVVLGLLATQTWLLVQLTSQNGRLLLRLDGLEARLQASAPSSPRMPEPPYSEAGLPVGAPAPSFVLSDIAGREHALAELLAAGKPLLLLFMDPKCGPCNALLPDVSRWQREYTDTATFVVISRGDPDSNRVKVEEHGLGLVLLQRDYEAATAYEAHGTPSAVLVRPDGTIGAAVAPGADAIRSLVARSGGPSAGPPWAGLDPIPLSNGHVHGHRHQHHGAHPQPARIGEAAPALTLPNLDGNTIDLADFKPDPVLLLFWNPGCGFCQQMLPDLRAWEAAPPTGAPRLLIVSTGTVDDNRGQGLRSPIVLDRDFVAGPRFGAGGTPMAVLVDAGGRIASETVAGAQAVLSMMGASRTPEPAS